MGEWEGLLGILTLAFGLGLVHALDADHILAVSTLSSTSRATGRRPWRFCTQWALGHGFTLFSIGTFVFLLGIAIPDALSKYAEVAVGLVLVGMGLWVFRDLRRQSLNLGFHSHHGELHHAHWHKTEQPDTRLKHHDHGATLVGALHGAAGSAPLLALIPILTHYSPAWGLAYLVVFNLGVLAAMLLFGGILGALFKKASHWGSRALNKIRAAIAGGSVLAGLYVLQSIN